ncbi:glycine betaine ABC transporter substrate-binding protein [Burkholderia sp. Ac-20353]|uniref:glycine betaine ABC transporter substrate-binding protein n=1 Tax=Burkholderia sp. Ac-20353 TaxID=2703894 RepID=UPI001F11CB4E|nr:glycine betaine ABC transporter substrate-binding protein [Burkholderia sp. Ac-20353]
MIRAIRRIFGCISLLTILLHTTASMAADEPKVCNGGKPIRFAQVTWESGEVFEEMFRSILEKGYGCKTELVTGASFVMYSAIINGDVDIFSEVWRNRVPAVEKAATEGKIQLVGSLLKSAGGIEGWFVPEYVIKGDSKRGIKPLAPDLVTVEDLKKYASIFRDDENPNKGRFYNCPTTWQCERDNTEKMKAYGMESSYVNFHPGTGAAFDTAITSAYKRGEPILFAYWKPSALMGQVKTVQLKEKAYNEACWETIKTGQPNPCASATPETALSVMVNQGFASKNPDAVELFKKLSVPLEDLNGAIAAILPPARTPARKIADDFIRSHPDLVSQWVSADVAKKVNAALR